MSETDQSHALLSSVAPNTETSFKGKDWLVSTSFGGAFKRSLYLIQHQFRWLVFVFFIGGFILSIILIPVNASIATFDLLITNEIFAPVPDLMLLVDLFFTSFSLGLVQRFVIFFGTFILGTFAVYHVLSRVPSLQVLISEADTVRFPLLSTLIAALITTTILTAASVILFIVPFLQVLFFFVPMFLVFGRFSLVQSFSLSISFRINHWMRILGALLLGYILNLFAGTLGVMIYQNIEVVLSLFGIPLGLAAPILLILLTQIPVAMVAPLIPLFSVAFFAGARGAYRERQHEKYMQKQKAVQPRRPRYIPLEDPSTEGKKLCKQCGHYNAQGMAYCTQCGQPMENDAPSS